MTGPTNNDDRDHADDERLSDIPSAARAQLGFWLIAFAFLITMAFSTVPAPLYTLYQARDGFSTFVITLIFAAYAVGVVIGLIFLGHVSDWVGRKRVLIPALGLEIVAAALFLADPSLTLLLLARFISGIGVGMLTATATAYLQDLHRLDRPNATPRRFEVVSTAANLGGLGVGALVAGGLAQYVGAPLRTSYAIFTALLAVSVVAVAVAPETVSRKRTRRPYRPQIPASGYGDRTRYVTANAAAFATFAVFGMFTSVAPAFVGGVLHHPSRLVAGLVVFAVFGSAAFAQTATSSLEAPVRLALGLGAEAVGLVALTVGMHAASMSIFLVASVITGVGAGVLFKSAIGSVASFAPPAQRGEALAGVFLTAYLGLSVPVLAMGIATRHVSAVAAMTRLSAVMLVILAGVAALSRTHVEP